MEYDEMYEDARRCNRQTKLIGENNYDNRYYDEEDVEADDFSNEFPNFSVLTEEEKVAFFEALIEARKKIEKKGLATRERFGTVHDEYLNYFNRDKKEKIGPKEDDSIISVKSCFSLFEDTSCSEESDVPLNSPNVDLDRCHSKSTTLVFEEAPTCAHGHSYSKKMKQEAWEELDSILEKDICKIVDKYLQKKLREESKGNANNMVHNHNPHVDSKLYQDLDYETPKKKFKKDTPRNEPIIEMSGVDTQAEASFMVPTTPNFNALNAEEKNEFFRILKEARASLIEKNPEKKDEILSLDDVMSRYTDSAPTKTVYTKVGDKDFKIKVEVTSGDNQRLKKSKDEDETSEILEKSLPEELHSSKSRKSSRMSNHSSLSDHTKHTQPSATTKPSTAPSKVSKLTQETKPAEPSKHSELKENSNQVVPDIIPYDEEPKKEEPPKENAYLSHDKATYTDEDDREEEECDELDEPQEKPKKEKKAKKPKPDKKEKKEKKPLMKKKKLKSPSEESAKVISEKPPKHEESTTTAAPPPLEIPQKEEKGSKIFYSTLTEKKEDVDLPKKDERLVCDKKSGVCRFQKVKSKPSLAEFLKKSGRVQTKRPVHFKESNPQIGKEIKKKPSKKSTDKIVKKPEEKTKPKKVTMKKCKEVPPPPVKKSKSVLQKSAECSPMNSSMKSNNSHKKSEESCETDSSSHRQVTVEYSEESCNSEEDSPAEFQIEIEKESDENCQEESSHEGCLMKHKIETINHSREECLQNYESSQEEHLDGKHTPENSEKSEKSSHEECPTSPKTECSEACFDKSLEILLEHQKVVLNKKKDSKEPETNEQEEFISDEKLDVDFVEEALTEKSPTKDIKQSPINVKKVDVKLRSLLPKPIKSEKSEKSKEEMGKSKTEIDKVKPEPEKKTKRQKSRKDLSGKENVEPQKSQHKGKTLANADELSGKLSSPETKKKKTPKATESKKFVENVPPETVHQDHVPEPKRSSEKVILVNDSVVEKIKSLIQYLEQKVKSKEAFETEYIQLVLGYIEYLTSTVESIITNYKSVNHKVHTTFHTNEIHAQALEVHSQESLKKPRKIPTHDRSRSETNLTSSERQAEKAARESEPEGLFKPASSIDLESFLRDVPLDDLDPAFTRMKAVPTTKIRLLQDLIKERAEFVEGSIDDFKIIHKPQGEYMIEDDAQGFKELKDNEEEQHQKAIKLKFIKNLINFCRCGKKQTDEDAILENLKGEAVRVDVTEGKKDPNSATLNQSTMDVLKAAERKKIIEKYYRKD